MTTSAIISIMELLRDSDVSFVICSEWLELKDVVSFDAACTNRSLRCAYFANDQ